MPCECDRKISDLSTEAKETALNQIVQALYREGRGFRPTFPWIFVRVLPREQVTDAGIVIQDLEQNKPFEEGLVAAVWNPFVRDTIRSGASMRQFMASEFQLGDHVLFPHWAGVPLHGFARDKWRVIKECEWDGSKDGGIFAKVEYAKPTTMTDAIEEVTAGFEFLPSTCEYLAEELEKRYVLLDKKRASVTLSGR